MNRISRFLCAGKSAAVVDGGEEERRDPMSIGRHGYRDTLAVTASSRLVVTGEPLLRTRSSDRQGTLSSGSVSHRAATVHHVAAVPQTAAPHTAAPRAAVTLTSASPVQQSAGISAGARPKQRPQPTTRETNSQVAPAPAPSGTRQVDADSVQPAPVLRVLPQQLSANGYQLTDQTQPFGEGTTQTVYSAIKKTATGTEPLEFVIKFPCKYGRERELKGLEIQKKLARVRNGCRYFVPVVETVMENGELVCHVEPKGTPLNRYIKSANLDLKQKLYLALQMITAVEVMHTQKIAYLDIKPANLIMKHPVTAMKVRFCDFDSAIDLEWAGIEHAGRVPVGTYEYACPKVLQNTKYFPVMADLWAFTLTVWMLMALEFPSVHWLSTMMDVEKRRKKMLSELAKCPYIAKWDRDSKGKPIPAGAPLVLNKQLVRSLIHSDNKEVRRRLQLFFLNNLRLPTDIDKLPLSAAEKCILKEMLSMMFAPSATYQEVMKQMTSLITAALHYVGTLETHSEHDEKKMLKIMREAGYHPFCNHGFVANLTRAIQPHLPGHSSDKVSRKVPKTSPELPGRSGVGEPGSLPLADGSHSALNAPDSDDCDATLPKQPDRLMTDGPGRPSFADNHGHGHGAFNAPDSDDCDATLPKQLDRLMTDGPGLPSFADNRSHGAFNAPDDLPDSFRAVLIDSLLVNTGDDYRRRLDGFIEQRCLTFQLEQRIETLELEDMLLDCFMNEKDSLDSLEKKDDDQLSVWLERQWRKRCKEKKLPSQLKDAC